jgi:hypothetical protein
MDVHLSSAQIVEQILLIFYIQEFIHPRFVPIKSEHSGSRISQMSPETQNGNFPEKEL